METHLTVPKRQFIPVTFLQIFSAVLSVCRRATVRCDYLVCGFALLPAVIAFCKNCINHVVTINKAVIGISTESRGWAAVVAAPGGTEEHEAVERRETRRFAALKGGKNQ